LAARTGETITVATRRAIAEKLRRIELHARKATLLEDMEAMQRRLNALPVLDRRSPEEILGYDDNGVPR
jgi:antitoxin VapB